MSVLPVEYPDFAEYSDGTRIRLTALAKFVQNAAAALVNYEFVLSVIGAFLNVFHLGILSRKSMRSSSSTNVLMIGIAFCDLFIMLFNTYATILQYMHPDVECWAPSSYPKLVLDLCASALKDDLRRLSAWLGVLMASVRFLIVKNSLNPKYEGLSRPSLGWKIILVLLILSSIVSSFYWARLQIIDAEPWTPAEHCLNFPGNFTESQYAIVNNDLFLKNDLLALQIFLFTDGILKIIPAITLPILTFLLIRELKVARSARKKITSGQVTDGPKKDPATNMVTIMTVTFMIAEGPLGIIYVLQGFCATKIGFLEITTNIIQILSIFVALNATTHCLICLTMSSQYRKCVKSVFICEVKPKVVCYHADFQHKSLNSQMAVSSKVSVTSATSVRNVIVEL